jgi:molecular chaperone DnaJ
MVLSPVGHRDYYEILGIPPESSAETITDAFHRLARRYHPDRSTELDAEERFKDITEAYSVLSDPAKRAEYDAARVAERYPSRPARWSHFFTVGVGVDADGLNRVCLGATGGTPSSTASDLRLEVRIPSRAAASATEQVVEYSCLSPCAACHGRGARSGTALRLCPVCGGTGHQLRSEGPNEIFGSRGTACERCDGTGLVVGQRCPACGGGGLCPGREWLKVRIPAGVEDGAVLRVRGRGLPGPMPGDPSGDLYLVVRIGPDRRSGRPQDALMGAVRPV